MKSGVWTLVKEVNMRECRHLEALPKERFATQSSDIKHFTSTSGAGIYQNPTHQSSSGSTNDGKDFEFCSTLDSIGFFQSLFQ